jgi:hypothetical protein
MSGIEALEKNLEVIPGTKAGVPVEGFVAEVGEQAELLSAGVQDSSKSEFGPHPVAVPTDGSDIPHQVRHTPQKSLLVTGQRPKVQDMDPSSGKDWGRTVVNKDTGFPIVG